MEVRQATTQADIQAARGLFEEYESWLGISLCFQNFARELAGLPGDYAPPGGRLFLVFEGEDLAGCIALRKLDEATCEMKRLFLRPQFRGRGLGRKIVQALIEEARQVGYARMRLDTLPGRMDEAVSLYRSSGFKEINAYDDSPVGGRMFMELDLAQGIGADG